MALEDYKDTVGLLAFIVTMLHMLSGTIICKDISQKGTSKGTNAMTFLGGIGMCVLNLRYALILKDPTMININLLGIALNVAYMLVYYFYSPDKMEVWNTIGKATAFVGIFLGYAHMEAEDKLEYRFGMLTTILMFLLIASPLFNLAEIMRTKSTETLPFPLIFMGTLVTFSWALYGIIIQNQFLIFQNGVNFILSALQLSLFVIYPSKPSLKKEQ